MILDSDSDGDFSVLDSKEDGLISVGDTNNSRLSDNDLIKPGDNNGDNNGDGRCRGKGGRGRGGRGNPNNILLHLGFDS